MRRTGTIHLVTHVFLSPQQESLHTASGQEFPGFRDSVRQCLFHACQAGALRMAQKRLLFVSMVLSLVLSSCPAFSQELLLFGGSGHDVFLGCLNCGEYASESICNEYGTYGSEYSVNSIFNEYSMYGNTYSLSSPWNTYSTSDAVPVVVDRDGNFYGYFTINTYRHNAVEFADTLGRLFDSANGNLKIVRKGLCGN